MAHLVQLFVILALPAFGLVPGAAIQVMLPPSDGSGPDVDTVLANLLGGSLDLHCHARISEYRTSEVLLVAEADCGCFGRSIKAGGTVAELRLEGRQTAEQKLAFAEALRCGHLVNKLALTAPVEAEDFDDDDLGPDDDDDDDPLVPDPNSEPVKPEAITSEASTNPAPTGAEGDAEEIVITDVEGTGHQPDTDAAPL